MGILSDLLDSVQAVARLAGNTALREFGSPHLEVRQKNDGSPVSSADIAAERVAREWLGAHYPQDAILGEEFGAEREGATRSWLLDPIDGTRTYIRGVPMWGTLVAVRQEEQVLAGCAYFPALGELIAAAPGLGCWHNGARTHVSAGARLSEALVLTTDETFSASPERRTAWRVLTSRAAMSRSWGDCYGYLLVATGRAEAMVDPRLSEWDSAALLPIIEEAGGVFTDWDGNRTIAGGSAIATNASLAAKVRSVLSGGSRP
jgi:histidinol phosphatase-like enzyme (inositol monophosphatase family)